MAREPRIPVAHWVTADDDAPLTAPDFQWEFEREDPSETLSGWTVTKGDAAFRPTCGGIDPSRLASEAALVGAIGGDYWRHTYWPGNSGYCFLDTAGQTITLVSPQFKLGPENRHIALLMGGTGDGASIRLEVEGVPRDGTAAFPQPDTLGMAPKEYAVSPDLFGHKARIVVESKGAGAILVDAIVGTSREVVWSQAAAPVWGYVDLHNHMFNHLTFGGRLIVGRVTEHPLWWDKVANLRPDDGMKHALEECDAHHGWFPGESAFSLSPDLLHGRQGFPTFDGWPKASTLVHEQVYVDWLKRAWQGGLRIIQLDVGNNEFAAEVFAKVNIWLKGDRAPLSTDDATATERTLDAVRDFVAGEGRGWAEVAYTSADARRIVAAGKLALVLGLEVDSIANLYDHCHEQRELWDRIGGPTCSTLPADPNFAKQELRKILDHLYQRGVRHVIPVHLIENAFGYPAVYGRAFDINSNWSNGEAFPLENGWSSGQRFRVDDDTVDGDSVLTWAMSVVGGVSTSFDPKRITGSPHPDRPAGYIAAGGLKAHGRMLLDEMARLGMLIDVQHMGEHATNETLAWAEAQRYPIMASHTGFREIAFGYNAKVPWDPQRSAETVRAYDTAQVERIASDALKSGDQLERIRKLGGMLGVGLGSTNVAGRWGDAGDDFCDDTSTTWKHAYRYALERMGGRNIAIGSDTNGLNGFPKARFGTEACLGATGDDFRKIHMSEMARRQENGVRYDDAPGRAHVVDAGRGRFADSGTGYAYSGEERDVWEALAEAEVAAFQPTPSEAFQFLHSYDQRAPFRLPDASQKIRQYAKGFWTKQHHLSPHALEPCAKYCNDEECAQLCRGPDPVEKMAYDAYPPETGSGGGDARFSALQQVVAAWLKMHGSNVPIHKYVVSGSDASDHRVRRDFDVNLEGLAHYGLLPDWLQDVKNVGVDERTLTPLFTGAEDYIEMWQRAETRAAELRKTR
jgi:microsomal dipeptidase-like Zn-dependent dipeptidase